MSFHFWNCLEPSTISSVPVRRGFRCQSIKSLFLKKPSSSYPEVLCKKGVLRNFTKITGKQLCQSLFFVKVTGLRPINLSKKRLWHRCFPVNFVKILRATFLQNTYGRLLLYLIKSHGRQVNCTILEITHSKEHTGRNTLTSSMKKQFGQSWNIITNLKIIINHLIDNHIWKQIVEPNNTSRALKPAFNWFIIGQTKTTVAIIGGSPQKNPEKMNVFGQKIDAVRAKINQTNFICT